MRKGKDTGNLTQGEIPTQPQPRDHYWLVRVPYSMHVSEEPWPSRTFLQELNVFSKWQDVQSAMLMRSGARDFQRIKR
jgi:hypothetical protein